MIIVTLTAEIQSAGLLDLRTNLCRPKMVNFGQQN